MIFIEAARSDLHQPRGKRTNAFSRASLPGRLVVSNAIARLSTDSLRGHGTELAITQISRSPKPAGIEVSTRPDEECEEGGEGARASPD